MVKIEKSSRFIFLVASKASGNLKIVNRQWISSIILQQIEHFFYHKITLNNEIGLKEIVFLQTEASENYPIFEDWCSAVRPCCSVLFSAAQLSVIAAARLRAAPSRYHLLFFRAAERICSK